MNKLISIITPCFNEEENVEELVVRVQAAMLNFNYKYEHIFIDNHSTDGTISILKRIAQHNQNVKIIRAATNFGSARTPFYALLQAKGDACILLPSDFQEPPELILDLVRAWDNGFKVALLVKTNSGDTFFRNICKGIFYNLMNCISEVKLIKNASGWGLVDRKIIEIFRLLEDPYPYFRGLVCEIGFPIAEIYYKQPVRERGLSKNNFFSLYDTGMQGIVHFSKIPLRLVSIVGFFLGGLCLLASLLFLLIKIIYWDRIQFGMAPSLVGIFFLGGVQLFSIGLLAEYIFSIHTKIRKFPLVIEEERVNF